MVNKIIYIAGDGRSGSTLLESVLANAKGTLSIGEGYRFFRRYYEADTLCGCNQHIENCELWSFVHKSLVDTIPNYSPKDTWEKIQFLLLQKNFSKIPKLKKDKNWELFFETVRVFYAAIFFKTKASVLIDASKSVGWLRILHETNIYNLEIIHLERRLESVANSWKKKVLLPEYYDKEVFMPVKSNITVLKNWLKIKYNLRYFRNETNYYFIAYEKFAKAPLTYKTLLEKLVNEEIDFNTMYFKENHAIGGNPMRSYHEHPIKINYRKETFNNLSFLEKRLFLAVRIFSKLLK